MPSSARAAAVAGPASRGREFPAIPAITAGTCNHHAVGSSRDHVSSSFRRLSDSRAQTAARHKPQLGIEAHAQALAEIINPPRTPGVQLRRVERPIILLEFFANQALDRFAAQGQHADAFAVDAGAITPSTAGGSEGASRAGGCPVGCSTVLDSAMAGRSATEGGSSFREGWLVARRSARGRLVRDRFGAWRGAFRFPAADEFM